MVNISFAGDIANGEKLAETCASCHGDRGAEPISNNPIIAGQHEDYLLKTIYMNLLLPNQNIYNCSKLLDLIALLVLFFFLPIRFLHRKFAYEVFQQIVLFSIK